MDFKIGQSFKASSIINIGKNKQQNSSTHSNPFGVSFKGNIIGADVFVNEKKIEISIAKPLNKMKLFFSAIINGNNIFNDKIKQSINKVSDFALRIKNETKALFTNASNKIKETMSNVAESMTLKPKEGSLKYYSKMSVGQLEEELTNEISNMNNNEGSNNG